MKLRFELVDNDFSAALNSLLVFLHFLGKLYVEEGNFFFHYLRHKLPVEKKLYDNVMTFIELYQS